MRWRGKAVVVGYSTRLTPCCLSSRVTIKAARFQFSAPEGKSRTSQPYLRHGTSNSLTIQHRKILPGTIHVRQVMSYESSFLFSRSPFRPHPSIPLFMYRKPPPTISRFLLSRLTAWQASLLVEQERVAQQPLAESVG
jgi:hypothetical protein